MRTGGSLGAILLEIGALTRVGYDPWAVDAEGMPTVVSALGGTQSIGSGHQPC